jgi:hypothetical protein
VAAGDRLAPLSVVAARLVPSMTYLLAADAVVLVHASFVAFVVGGSDAVS